MTGHDDFPPRRGSVPPGGYGEGGDDYGYGPGEYGYGEDEYGYGRGRDEYDPDLRAVEERVRRVMHSTGGPPGDVERAEMRPDFRSRLRADLVAARADIIAARIKQGTGYPAAPPDAPPYGYPPQAGPAPGRTQVPDIRQGPVPPQRGQRPPTGAPRRPAGAPGRPAGGPGRPSTGPGGRTRSRRRSRVLSLAATLLIVVLAGSVALAYGFFGSRGPKSPALVAVSDINGNVSAGTGGPIRIKFSQPVDKAATAKAVRLNPAVAVSTSWEGDTLTVSPTYGLASNSAYVLTVDHQVARTASGQPLAQDLHVLFGTGDALAARSGTGTPDGLGRTTVAAGTEGSEAVVTLDGSLLLTSGSADGHSGLLRMGQGATNQGTAKLGTATSAICVSRSGHSVAYLSGSGTQTQVVFADAAGTAQHRITSAVDNGSPLGWIDDNEVTFVGGGLFRAVNRSGQVRVLSRVPVDAAHDAVVFAPGGRYVYLKPAASGRTAQVIDLITGIAHPLSGIVGEPAFSADGGTVVWIDGSGSVARVDVAAAGGGPVTSAPLPVQAGEQISDLSVSPDGARLAYSVTRPGTRGELRVASLPDGRTLAVSNAGVGESPNWSPSGREFTVLAHTGAGPRIETIEVPGSTTDPRTAVAAAVSKFTNAQINGDVKAQQSLAASGVALPNLPNRVNRATLLWTVPGGDGTTTATVRLIADPQPGHPVTEQADETITLGPPASGGRVQVRAVSVGAFGPAPGGPQVVRADTRTVPGAVLLTFDSDLDQGSVSGAFQLLSRSGAAIQAKVSYNPANRTVTVRPASGQGGNVVQAQIGTALQDVNDQHATAQVRVPAALSG